jgi:RNA polymerase sigma-70 factor, ECF subfamily
VAKSCVMDPLVARIRRVSELLVEPMPAVVSEERGSETFEALYRRTFPRVYAYVASLLRDRAAAEDVTALAFERAYRKRLSFRAHRGTADAWMFGIARNAALDELRKRKRRATLEAEPEDVEADTPQEYAELTIRREAVRAALATLDARERDLVALKVSGGLSNGEIARVLRISESSAGSRLHRTMEKLREACDDNA